jgi:hypothetical protein
MQHLVTIFRMRLEEGPSCWKREATRTPCAERDSGGGLDREGLQQQCAAFQKQLQRRVGSQDFGLRDLSWGVSQHPVLGVSQAMLTAGVRKETGVVRSGVGRRYDHRACHCDSQTLSCMQTFTDSRERPEHSDVPVCQSGSAKHTREERTSNTHAQWAQ